MSKNIAMPQLLKDIMIWEKDIAPEVPEWETPTGYFLQFKVNDNGGYGCSPADSIVFANTGMDGIHFSLLTDFGSISDLNEAPVICVSPMDFDNQVRIVANNIHDFFSLSFLGHGALLLNDFPTKESYLTFLEEQASVESDDDAEMSGERSDYANMSVRKQLQDSIRERAIERFNLQPITDPYDYISKARATRAASIAVPTASGLGIDRRVAALLSKESNEASSYKGYDERFAESSHQPAAHPWVSIEIPTDKPAEVMSYIESAQLLELMIFVRDYQHQYIANDQLLRVLCDKLEQHGFELEAQRLLHCMPSPQSYSGERSGQDVSVHHHIAWYSQ